jgi:hypothetical protein
MTTIELTSPLGRLTLRRVIEESLQHLSLLVIEGFVVKPGYALLDPDGSYRIRVDSPMLARAYGPDRFFVVLPEAEIAALDQLGFMSYLTLRFVSSIPEPIRARCSGVLDTYAVHFGLPSRAELLSRPPTPTVPADLLSIGGNQ